MEYKKKKEFLLCIDSDGCTMDAMDIKHIKAFGPCLIKEWDLFAYAEVLLQRWNAINLYTMTRGVNRFKGLAMFLEEVDRQYQKIEGLGDIQAWVCSTKELSEASLIRELEKRESLALKKSLVWSKEVNRVIKSLPKEAIKPFEGVKNFIEKASKVCDIAIVSSANKEAIIKEWERYDLLKYVDIVMAQDLGNKRDCIQKLLRYGYEKENVIMVGDAKGDMEAAYANGVHFYPILVGKEKESWESLNSVLKRVMTKSFDDDMQKMLEKKFYENLGG